VKSASLAVRLRLLPNKFVSPTFSITLLAHRGQFQNKFSYLVPKVVIHIETTLIPSPSTTTGRHSLGPAYFEISKDTLQRFLNDNFALLLESV